jgi:hypothetical protein
MSQVAHLYDYNTNEVEVGRSPVWGQSGLCREPCIRKQTTKRNWIMLHWNNWNNWQFLFYCGSRIFNLQYEYFFQIFHKFFLSSCTIMHMWIFSGNSIYGLYNSQKTICNFKKGYFSVLGNSFFITEDIWLK